MKITIEHFKQVCDAMASNADDYNANAYDEQIKFQQDLLATLPAETKKESLLPFFKGKQEPEMSARERCISKIEALITSKGHANARIIRLRHLKDEADQFIESQLRQHPNKIDIKSGNYMPAYEKPISSDQLAHASAILTEFMQNLEIRSVGVQAAADLMGMVTKACEKNKKAESESRHAMRKAC